MLARDLGWKRIHKPRRVLSGFLQIFIELCRSKVQPASPHGNFINGVAKLEIVYMLLLFQILCIDWFFFFFLKKSLLWKKISWIFNRNLNGSEAAIWKFFEKWMLWVLSFLNFDAFLPIWILFALDFFVVLSSGYRHREF